MAPDHDPDDERHGPDDPLPPEDRLWRHPSELAAGINPPAAWFGSPPTGSTSTRRSLTASALAGACLAGAVVAVGAMWLTRPTQVVERHTAATAASAVTTASFAFTAVPTERLSKTFGPSLPSVRALRAGTWISGSGAWLDDRGTVLTASPLVAGATEVIVTGIDGVRQPAEVAGTDAATGVTALKVSRTSGTPLPTDRTAAARAGEPVAIVGSPSAEAGQRATDASTATAVIRVASMRSTVADLLLHDAVELDRIVPADAVGGLLVDAGGHVVGLTIGTSSERSLGVVTPAADAVKAGTALRDHGRVDRALLGVRAVDLDPAAATLMAIPGGARLTVVMYGSPAASAGLRSGDVVTGVDGYEVDDASDLVVALRRLQPGDHITMAVRQGRRTVSRSVTLGG